MTCTTKAAPSDPTKFDIIEDDASIYIGDPWTAGPNATMKDVRYYYNTCLE